MYTLRLDQFSPGVIIKTALISGGGRGIGRAIAMNLGAAGCRVAITAMSNRDAAEKTAHEITEAGGSASVHMLDVRDRAACEQLVSKLVSEYGSLDILVNNAGIIDDGLFVMMSPDAWQSVLSTTLDGFYNLTKPSLKSMVRRKSGSIVSISSVSGIIGNKGQVNYSAAKAGLIGASRSLAWEVARLGIRVNVVAPGLIDTDMLKSAPVEDILPMIPMRRIGKPEEVAAVVGFLCSDLASYITGQVISVNGGMC